MTVLRSLFSVCIAVNRQLLGSLLVFAVLVGNAAACLACALAGSLALTASAVNCAVLHVAGIQSHDVFHCYILLHSGYS